MAVETGLISLARHLADRDVREMAALPSIIRALQLGVTHGNLGQLKKMSDDNKSNEDDKGAKKGGEFRVPPRTWIVWIAIFGGIILLMLMRDKWETQGENLPQWQFMQLYDSNQVSQAVVNYNPQNPLLVEIIGK